MNKSICVFILLCFTSAVHGAQCAKTDLAGKKWHIYSSNSAALYCLVTVAKSNNKVSGFCKSSTDFDQGTEVAITGGKLSVNKSCSITGSIKMAAEGVSQIFGSEDTVIKMVKSKMPGSKKAFHGLFSINGPSFSRSSFSAVLN
ncbi:MAG: hypothetical protein V7709_02910 [Halioglobus sp.]